LDALKNPDIVSVKTIRDLQLLLSKQDVVIQHNTRLLDERKTTIAELQDVIRASAVELSNLKLTSARKMKRRTCSIQAYVFHSFAQ